MRQRLAGWGLLALHILLGPIYVAAALTWAVVAFGFLAVVLTVGAGALAWDRIWRARHG